MHRTNVRMEENMAEKLTKRQSEVLQEIKSHYRREKIAPSVRELAEKLKITPSTTHKLLRILQSKGYIELRDNISRGIVLPKAVSGNSIRVPVIGRIPAGNPVHAEEVFEGHIEIDPELVPRGELFALKVMGDSMIGASIMDGDTAIIRHQEDADSGEIVAVAIDGEATLKRLRINDSRTFLHPENTDFSPIELSPEQDIRILGKLVAVIRKY